MDDEYSKPNELPLKSLIRLQKSNRHVVFYNSLASERIQVVTLRVSHYNVEVGVCLLAALLCILNLLLLFFLITKGN